MEKRDWYLLGSSVLICSVVCCIVNSFYTISNPVSFWVSLISACITTIGFFFTIRFQLRIDIISKAIEQNSNTIYRNIHQELTNYHLGKAITLSNSIESEVRNCELKTTLSLINQLQEELAECIKIFSVNLIKHLQDCFSCDDFTNKSMKEILNECKKRSQNEKNESMQELSSKLANHYVNLNSHILSSGHTFAFEPLVRDMENLKGLLNSAKTPVTNFFI